MNHSRHYTLGMYSKHPGAEYYLDPRPQDLWYAMQEAWHTLVIVESSTCHHSFLFRTYWGKQDWCELEEHDNNCNVILDRTMTVDEAIDYIKSKL